MGSAHPDAPTTQLSRGILAHSTSIDRILTVDYRLSTTRPDEPTNHFPAALLDCVAAYRYLLVNLGFDSRFVTVVGESADGNLAFALMRHLVENDIPELPPPRSMLACPPLLDS